jgi:hypothetical protein
MVSNYQLQHWNIERGDTDIYSLVFSSKNGITSCLTGPNISSLLSEVLRSDLNLIRLLPGGKFARVFAREFECDILLT